MKESWDASKHPLVAVEEMAQMAKQSGTEMVVVTGGEPAMYDLAALTSELHQAGLKTNIETSGVYALSGEWDWVYFSPKKFKAPHSSVYADADELKIVVYNKSDFEWAEEHASRVGPGCELFLQPEWSKEKEMLPMIIDYVKANPRWKISLQIHKYMNIP